jgi:trehalose 6-phosphate phosphatase
MRPLARGIPHLLAHWDSVAARIRAHDRIAVFLDFDGTLVAIAPRPEQVRLTSATRRILRRLARHPRATVVLISGRRRAELLRFVGIRGIRYFGLYGWERSATSALPARVRDALRRARARLQHHLLRAHRSVWIENKRRSFSVHLLDVPPAVQPRVRRELRALLQPFRRTLRVAENLRDVEILPRSILGKGMAVRRFLSQPAFRRCFSIYFGDDLSDESAFLAVRRGVSVHVGKGRATRARYSLRSPAEVTTALAKLGAVLAKK